MPKKENDNYNLEDILSSLDDEEEINDEDDADDLVDMLSNLDNEDDNKVSPHSSLDDYASQLIKELEAEFNKDDLSALESMVESNEESDLDCDDLMSILDNLDSLEDQDSNENCSNDEDDTDDLVDMLANLDDEETVESQDEDDDKSIEELFDEFIQSIKNLSSVSKEKLAENLKVRDIKAIEDLSEIGLKISYDGSITDNNLNKKIKKIRIKENYNSISVRFLKKCFKCSELDSSDIVEVIIDGDLTISDSFHNCPNLSNLVCKGRIEFDSNTSFVNCDSITTVFDGCSYLRVNGNSTYVLNVGNKSVSTVEVASGCEVIGKSAFIWDNNLTEIILPNSVKDIQAMAFAGCSNLKEIKLNDNLEIIDTYSFADCTSLSKLVIPSSVKTVEKKAFDGCRGLKEVVISKNTKVESNSFPVHTKITYR